MFSGLEGSETPEKSQSWVNRAVGSRLELLEAIGSTISDGGTSVDCWCGPHPQHEGPFC